MAPAASDERLMPRGGISRAVTQAAITRATKLHKKRHGKTLVPCEHLPTVNRAPVFRTRGPHVPTAETDQVAHNIAEIDTGVDGGGA